MDTETTNVTLVYPMTDKVENKSISYQSEDGVIVLICFVDLYHLKESLTDIVDVCYEDLSEDAYIAALETKLHEEVAEYQKDKNLEEMADVI